MDTVNERLHAQIYGHVQGVSFRYFVLTQAQQLHINGWVRNVWDGSVEVVAEGKREQLEKFLALLIRGPGAARVQNVLEKWQPATGEFSGFHIRSTV
jgi:acylphosphatase